MDSDLYDKIARLNHNFGIWRYTNRFRITFVATGWLILWDHENIPPTRYDCHKDSHHDACVSVINILDDLKII